jgi:hypothetical protein
MSVRISSIERLVTGGPSDRLGSRADPSATLEATIVSDQLGGVDYELVEHLAYLC